DTMAVSLDMIRDGFPLVWALNRRWNFGLEEVPVAEIFDPSITARRTGKQPVSDRGLIPKVVATWQALEELAGETEEMLERGTAVV
ncbi:MAG: hypothetical protein M3Q49_10710, partial [Actinomycetota bacterium]|nr:hypothetical protein [Actinomycetota bacterium]